MAFFEAMKTIRRSDTAPIHIGGLEVSRLEQSEAFFHHQTDAIFVFDAAGTIIYFNEHLPEILGYSEHTLYEHFSVFNPPDQMEAVSQFFQRALQGETVHYTARGLHADQHLVTLKITNMPIEQEGHVIGVYGVARDVTREKQLEEDVSEIRSQLELTEQVPELVLFYYDLRSHQIEPSPSLLKFLGLREEQSSIEQQRLLERIHPWDFDPLRFEIERMAAGKQDQFEQELSLLTSDGSYQLLRLKAVRRAGHAHQASIVLYDLSEIDAARQQLKMERAQARDIYEAVNAAISQIDLTTGRILFHSQGFLHIYEELPKNLILNDTWLLSRIDPRDHDAMRKFMQRLLQGHAGTLQYRLRFPDGRIKWVEDQQIPIFHSDGSIAYSNSILHDITLQKAYEEQLRQLALRDVVTGLPNRQALIETIESWQARTVPFFVLSVSFNRITEINNAFGHGSGDQWLQATAARLNDVKPDEVFLGHLGGDEYALLVSTDYEQDVTPCAERLLTISTQPISIEPYALFARVSIGISRYPQDSTDAVELLKHSYTALRRSRRDDHSAFHHYASNLDIDYYRRYRLEQDLHYAIERDQLFLEYQPKVDSWTGKIVGMEALIRWQHPEWGRIPPNDFIPLSEESALHIDIGDWVLEAACRQMNEWSKTGASLVPISINVSPKRLLIPGFEHQIEQTLIRYALDPALLELEITEAALIMDDPMTSRTLESVSALGVRIALDDFGKGYSSMVYLQRYPIDVIKIDRQFATHIYDDAKAQAIVKSILYMANEFNLHVVAEGIETIQQLDTFRMLECPRIQGYLFSRPVPSDVMEGFLIREILYPIEACALSSDTVPRFSVPGKIRMLTHHTESFTLAFSDLQAHQTSTKVLYFSTETPLPSHAATCDIRLNEGLQLVTCTVTIIGQQDGQYMGEYTNETEAEQIMRFFQSLRYTP